jgi:hypothetical protein
MPSGHSKQVRIDGSGSVAEPDALADALSEDAGNARMCLDTAS